MILVTGATGFLGAELVVQLLEQGRAVRCIKRENAVVPSKLLGKTIEWCEADLLDYYSLENAFGGVSEVYHCAALVSFKSADRAKLQQVNAAGTANIVNLCLEHSVKKLLYVSSVAALGESKNGRLIDEKNHWEFNDSQSGYAISKYEGEMEVWRGIAEGLNAVIVNPSVIIGRDAGTKGSGVLFETVRKGLRFYTSGSVGLVDVTDVARAMVLLMESPVSAKRFILNSENLGFRELFSMIADGYGLKKPFIKLNPFIMGLAWRGAKLLSFFSGKSYSLTRETAISAFKKNDYDNRHFLEAFPSFKFTPLKASVGNIVASPGLH